MPCFFMCSITACAITALPCGRRNAQVSLPACSTAGENISCTVFDSATVSAIATALTVTDEPITTSTLSSVTKRRAFCTARVGSLASSSRITFSFSPATVSGHSLM